VQTRQLGNSDMHITPVGFGAWAVGGPWKFGWGQQEDDESIAAIHHALDLGINWIDTAAAYGLGHSEEVVARALKGISQRPYVFTKCQTVWDENGNPFGRLKKDSIRAEIEASLRRLQVDVIDLYQMHWPDPDEDIEEGWAEMAKLKQEGKVRWIGVSNFSVAQMERAASIAPITSLQPPYSLIKRGVEDSILPYCGQHNIGVIVYSPMQSGLLTGRFSKARMDSLPADDWRRREYEFEEPQLSHNLKLADKLVEIARRRGRSAGEAAVAWTLRRPEVTAAIVGFRNPAQIDGIIGAMEFRLSAEEIAEIEAFQASLA